ncbi:glycosyltransferase [Flavobacterium sp. Fl-318]|uniref:Glycosyltransferase n=1 Tax=Flavobacterium cupriresistens TaxID=2893885 RepID=A0ABU4RC00_9FLAO|nr:MULTISPECIES: glycosyltransferase [unclassified Flavobacterium]MDX6190116.1 glycosyltransferase [Flavobacterium sp. Fl-318]UFH42937.1 glycosyltransferase [Flavobacterium sp. F-323]
MNREKGLVSVIIPSYNYGCFITETIKSLQAQSYTNWEAIIVDDCSLDNTQSIVEILITQESRLFYEKHTVNKGLPATRNTGLRKAKGEFILFLDADDVISPKKLKLHIEHFTQNCKIDISYSNYFFFRDGHINDRYFTRMLNHEEGLRPSEGGREILFPIFLRDNMIAVLAPLVKASLVEEVGYFNEELRQKEDWDFWMRCVLKEASFAYLDNPDAYGLIRVHGGSLLDNKKEALSYSDEFYTSLGDLLLQNSSLYCSELKQYESFMKKRMIREFVKKSLKMMGLMSFARKVYKKVNIFKLKIVSSR